MSLSSPPPTPPTPPASPLRIISAGAAKGLVQGLEVPFTQLKPQGIPVSLESSFGAVGAMKDIFLTEIKTFALDHWAGLVVISSQTILTDLIQASLLDASTLTPIGWVSTAMARLEGDASISPMAQEEALKEALLHAPVIYAPDTEQSTAGIHFKKVLMALELWPLLKDRVHNFPNGAAAMGQMAQDKIKGALGCTQVTEINYTPGVEVISLLPQRFELNTLYSAACAFTGHHPQVAKAFIDFVCGQDPRAQKARLEGGFFDR